MDVEELLDAALEKKEVPAPSSAPAPSEKSKSGSSPRDDSRERRSSRRSRSRSRSRSPRRHRSRDRHHRRRRDSGSPRRRYSRSPRRRSRSPRRRRSRSRSPRRHRRRSRSPSRRGGRNSPSLPPAPMSEEERDARTIVVIQLARNVTNRDIRDFFEKGTEGRVREVRMVSDRNSRRSKGIAYVEFVETDSIPKAHNMSGQRLLGVPIMVMPTQAEKNRLAEQKAKEESFLTTRITVSNLPAGITDEQLKMLFTSFGRIRDCQVFQGDGGASTHGFVQYDKAVQAQVACEKMNNFNVADRNIRVSLASGGLLAGDSMGMLDRAEVDKTGIQMSSHSRAMLMDKLSAAHDGGQSKSAGGPKPTVHIPELARGMSPVATNFLLLKHMFDPKKETDPEWELDIRDEVLEECSKQGKIFHIFVDKEDPDGCVYMKFQTSAAAGAAHRALNGRFFAGQQISAAFMSQDGYYYKFPQAKTAISVLTVES